MRRASRRDANHAEIVDALERAGCRVIDLSLAGDSVPDLLVYRPATGLLRLVELKTPKGRLSKGQQEFARLYPVWVVRSISEAYAAMDLLPRRAS